MPTSAAPLLDLPLRPASVPPWLQVARPQRLLSPIERLLGAPADEWPPIDAAAMTPQRVAAGATLFLQGAPAHHVYLVQAGDFKLLRTAEDGYEQVLDFAGRLELLGFDGIASGLHPSSAVALEDAVVYAMPLAGLDALRRRHPRLDEHLQTALSRQLARQGDLAWLMAPVSADGRCARFLLHLSRRMAERGQSPDRLVLRLSRRDIASHLGLSHESVSRSFTTLDAAGCVHVHYREVVLLDREALAGFARATRRSARRAGTAPD